MNNKSSLVERFLISMILAWVAMQVMNNYFGPNKTAQVKDRPLPAQPLVKAFAGIDPQSGPALNATTGAKEVKTLEAAILKNEKDEYSRWAKLRIGLIKQYVTGDLPVAERKTGFLNMGPKMEYFAPYDDVINGGHKDEVRAQALYQTGDLFWRKSLTAPQKKGETEAINAFETMVADERASKEFRDAKIYVTKEKDPAKVLPGVPAAGFETKAVHDVRGTLATPDPQGILDRINEVYQGTWLFKFFNGLVNFLGADPKYSYGLAILIFAVGTRFLMQPLSKKQYESMKGMALIAPEMKKIQERYKNKNDQESQVKMITEIRALQKRHGVNPSMGCVLAFVQMPIFFFLVYPMIKHYQPHMDLAGAQFLWIASLSQRDIPLLIMYGISMFFSFRLSSTPPTDEQQRNMQIMMSFVMPLVLPFFLITYPSAFVMYWMAFNIMSTTFQWRMMKNADPKKNMVKTLMGEDLRKPIGSTTTESKEAVPPRPKDDKGGKGGSKSKSSNAVALDDIKPLEGGSPEKNGSNGSGNGLNGHLNGKPSPGGESASGNSKPGGSGSKKKKR